MLRMLTLLLLEYHEKGKRDKWGRKRVNNVCASLEDTCMKWRTFICRVTHFYVRVFKRCFDLDFHS